MIAIALITVGLIAVLFGAPALVGPIRNAHARRAAVREAQEAATERGRQEALAEQQRVDELWRQDPDLAGLGEWLRYEHRMQMPLVQEAQEARRLLEQREEQVRHRAADHGGREQVSGGYRILVLTGLVLFLVVFFLGIALDYLIFRGLHPGTVLLPAGLACLAVFGITIGSVLFLGAGRHHLMPDSASPYARRVVSLGGALLAAGIAMYMITIAPNRSAPAGEAAINAALRDLHSDQSAVPPALPAVIAQDQQAVQQAKVDLAHSEDVDRLSAGTLAILEIPLAEAAVLGAGLMMLGLARRRREDARQDLQEATDAVARANARFSADLVAILISKGHTEDVIHRIRQRVDNFGPAWNGLRSLPGGPSPASAGAHPGGGMPGGLPGGMTGGGSPGGGMPTSGMPANGAPGSGTPGGGMRGGGMPAAPAASVAGNAGGRHRRPGPVPDPGTATSHGASGASESVAAGMPRSGAAPSSITHIDPYAAPQSNGPMSGRVVSGSVVSSSVAGSPAESAPVVTGMVANGPVPNDPALNGTGPSRPSQPSPGEAGLAAPAQLLPEELDINQ